MTRALLVLSLLVLSLLVLSCLGRALSSGAGIALAEAACAAPGEPSLTELSRSALKLAALEPERTRSLLNRVRVAALLPHLQLRVGRGSYDNVRNPEALEPTFTSTETWRFDVAVSFSLDRLIFDPHELRAAEAAGRLVELRAQLLERVAALWSARRDLEAVSAAPLSTAPPDENERDRCTELTVLLEAMTGRSLRLVSRPTRFSLPDAVPRR